MSSPNVGVYREYGQKLGENMICPSCAHGRLRYRPICPTCLGNDTEYVENEVHDPAVIAGDRDEYYCKPCNQHFWVEPPAEAAAKLCECDYEQCRIKVPIPFDRDQMFVRNIFAEENWWAGFSPRPTGLTVPNLNKIPIDWNPDNERSITYDQDRINMRNIYWVKLPTRIIGVGLFQSIQSFRRGSYDYAYDSAQMTRMVFDLDSSDLRESTRDLLILVYQLAIAGFTIDSVWFSGNKGYHVEVSFFGNFMTGFLFKALLKVYPLINLDFSDSQLMMRQNKALALVLKERLGLNTLDVSIYNNRRLLRMPYSVHEKTGLVKAPVPSHLFTTDAEAFLDDPKKVLRPWVLPTTIPKPLPVWPDHPFPYPEDRSGIPGDTLISKLAPGLWTMHDLDISSSDLLSNIKKVTGRVFDNLELSRLMELPELVRDWENRCVKLEDQESRNEYESDVKLSDVAMPLLDHVPCVLEALDIGPNAPGMRTKLYLLLAAYWVSNDWDEDELIDWAESTKGASNSVASERKRDMSRALDFARNSRMTFRCSSMHALGYECDDTCPYCSDNHIDLSL